MDVCVRFGQRCKQLRKKENSSQEKIALLIEMDRTYYSSIENGRRNVSIRNIEKIANGFGISIEELVKGV